MSIYMLLLGIVLIHLYIIIGISASSVPIDQLNKQEKSISYGGSTLSFLSSLIPANNYNLDSSHTFGIVGGNSIILGGNNIIDDLLSVGQEQLNLTAANGETLENKQKLLNDTNRNDNQMKLLDYGLFSSSSSPSSPLLTSNSINLKNDNEFPEESGEIAEMHTNNHQSSSSGHNSRYYNNYHVSSASIQPIGHHKSKYQSTSSNPYANTLNLNYIHSLLTKPISSSSNQLSNLLQSTSSNSLSSPTNYGFTLQNNNAGSGGYMTNHYSSGQSLLASLNNIQQQQTAPKQQHQPSSGTSFQDQSYNNSNNINSNTIDDTNYFSGRMCGRQQVGTREPRIVGGNNTYEGEFPWAVSIQRHGNHHCGGVIVGKRWILTAAHCVRSQLVGNLVVRTGGHTLSRSNNHINNHLERDYLVDQIIMHGDFSRYDNLTASQMKSSANTNNADIALLRLKYDIHWNEFAWPVCFPNRDAGNFSGHDAIVIGWGKLNEKSEDFSNELQKVKLTIIDNKVCQNWFRQAGRDMPIDDRIICAGFKSGGKDACHGDSGGPLLSKINGHYVVVGVVSTGIGCARPLLPGLYSRVSSYIGWLEGYVD